MAADVGGIAGIDAATAGAFLGSVLGSALATALVFAAGSFAEGRTGAGAGFAPGVFDFAFRTDALETAAGFSPAPFALRAGTRAAVRFAAGCTLLAADRFATTLRATLEPAFAGLGAGFADLFLAAGATGFFAFFAADLRTGFAELRLFFVPCALFPEAFAFLGATHRLLAVARRPGYRPYFNVGR